MSFRALVLAGRRDADDPLARAAGAPHRALLDVDGRPMLERVLATLAAHPRVGPIAVSIDAPELMDRFPALAEARERGEFTVCESAGSPSRSVLAAFDAAPDGWPWLVTTADHALLDAAILDHFFEGATASGADLAVGLVSRTAIEARFPGARRTYLPFRGESYSARRPASAVRPTLTCRCRCSSTSPASRSTRKPWGREAASCICTVPTSASSGSDPARQSRGRGG